MVCNDYSHYGDEYCVVKQFYFNIGNSGLGEIECTNLMFFIALNCDILQVSGDKKLEE